MNDNLIPKQYSNNFGVMSKDNFYLLKDTKVVIVGLGGLGGNLANNLVRLGVTHLKLVDYDKFDQTNLNRQLFSNSVNVGNTKVEIVKEELLKINKDCKIEIINDNIQNVSLQQFNKYDYIIDAVDNPKTKIYLAELSEKLSIPLLHGACAGWYGQIGWILPGNKLLHDLYGKELFGIEKELMNPSFTPAIVAGLMTSEFLKMIQKSDQTTINELLLVDVLNNTMIKTGKDIGELK